MIKCEKGELEVKGKTIDILAELVIIFKGMYESGHSKEEMQMLLDACDKDDDELLGAVLVSGMLGFIKKEGLFNDKTEQDINPDDLFGGMFGERRH